MCAVEIKRGLSGKPIPWALQMSQHRNVFDHDDLGNHSLQLASPSADLILAKCNAHLNRLSTTTNSVQNPINDLH
jgi:hypothetical protein